jgi:predicted exporter
LKFQRQAALAWALVACLLLGHQAWLWLGKRIVPDTDILALLPSDQRDPVLQRSFDHMVDAAQQRVIVLVGAPDWNDARRAADAYSAAVGAEPGLLTRDNLDEQAQADWIAPFREHALLLVSARQQEQLRTENTRFWTDAALARLYSAFGGPKLGAFRDDPFGLFTGWVEERARETPVRPRDGHLFVAGEGRQYVLLPLRLKTPAFSLSTQEKVMPLLRKAADAARAAAPSAEVIQAGVVLHAAEGSSRAGGEVSTIGLGSLAGIVLLTFLAFRSLRPILLVLLSIGVGLAGALSVCWLLFGRVHLLTLVFGASLIGVAQDYGIYYLCNRMHAPATLDSVRLLRRLLPGLALTLLAAVLGYAGLALTPFPGLRHMAVFSALGLAFAWLTVVCWFPLLAGPGSLRHGALARRYEALLDRLPRLPQGRYALALLGIVTALAAFGWQRLHVNDDLRALQAPSPELVRDQMKLAKLLDAPSPVQYFLVRGESEEEVLQREEALRQRLDPLVGARRISGYQAISNWVPSQREQAARRALVESKLLADGGPLDELGRSIGEDQAWAGSVRDHLRAAASPMRLDAFMQSPAAEPSRYLWLGKGDGQYASVVALRGIDYSALPVLRQAADGLAGVQWVDKVAGISSVLGQYRHDMGWVLAGAYGLVFLLLLPRYRGQAWRVLAPVASASAITLALLGYAGQSLQLFHVLALMLLLGVGVDYGIFMQEERERRAAPWLAVGLSAVNTILSFGLLALSGTAALRAFGLTMLLGTALVWAAVPLFASKREIKHAESIPA